MATRMESPSVKGTKKKWYTVVTANCQRATANVSMVTSIVDLPSFLHCRLRFGTEPDKSVVPQQLRDAARFDREHPGVGKIGKVKCRKLVGAQAGHRHQ